MLATQNPVDIDYKGLTNAGTWFIGKLQTERDKDRLLEGLESVMAESGTLSDRRYLDRLISSLDSRVFVLHNVHEDKPILFMTRWALSFLRGPLTRRQIREVMAPYKQNLVEAPSIAQGAFASAPSVAAAQQAATPKEPKIELPPTLTSSQPRVNARVPQFYLPVMVSDRRAVRSLSAELSDEATIELTRLAYAPYLIGSAMIHYTDSKRTQLEEERLSLALPLPDGHSFVDWSEHVLASLDLGDLGDEPHDEALFTILDPEMQDSPPYTSLRKELENYIYRQRAIPLWTHPKLDLTSKIGESQKAFLERCENASKQALADEIDDLKNRFKRDLDKLQDRLDREERELEEDEAEFEGRKREELLSAGESLVGMLLGRRRSSALSQASRKRRMTSKAKADIAESEATIEDLKGDIAEMLQEQEKEIAVLTASWGEVADSLQETALRPKKTDIHIEVFGLGWAPHWLVVYRDERGTLRDEMLPAYTFERNQED